VILSVVFVQPIGIAKRLNHFTENFNAHDSLLSDTAGNARGMPTGEAFCRAAQFCPCPHGDETILEDLVEHSRHGHMGFDPGSSLILLCAIPCSL